MLTRLTASTLLRLTVSVAARLAAILTVCAPTSVPSQEVEGLTYDRIAWSPDGRQLAFGATWGGDEEIYVVDVDGSNLTRLTDNDRTDTSVSFSPDGHSVIYVSAMPRGGGKADYDVFTVDIETGESKLLYGLPGRSEQWPLMMNDGHLAVSVTTASGVIDLIAVELDSGATQTLIGGQGRNGWGSFARDGRRMVYASNRLRGGWTFDLFVANADGSNDRHLDLYPSDVDGMGSVFPDFFPDGERFVYRSDKDGYEPGDNYHYVHDLESGRDERLPRPDGATIGMPTVSPDGRTIAFAADYNQDGERVISMMDMATMRVRYVRVSRPR